MSTGYSILYLLAVQSLLVTLSATMRSRRAAGLVAGLVLLPLTLLGGPLLHERDLASPAWAPWVQYVALASPVRWVLPTLVRRVYAADVVAASVANIMCRNKQVSPRETEPCSDCASAREMPRRACSPGIAQSYDTYRLCHSEPPRLAGSARQGGIGSEFGCTKSRMHFE